MVCKNSLSELYVCCKSYEADASNSLSPERMTLVGWVGHIVPADLTFATRCHLPYYISYTNVTRSLQIDISCLNVSVIT